VVADCLYGNSPTFLDAVDACVGITALMAIPSETRCWLQRPQTEEKRYRYKGEARAKRVVVEPDRAPSTVATVAAHLPASSWYHRQVSEGTKGPIKYEFARQRVTLCKDGLPDHTVWLVIKRTLGTEPSYVYALSNAPVSTPLSTFVWLSGLRWAVEQCFEESKTELGMDHYEVRKYAGWHHHMLTTMLAHFFLWHLKRRLGKKSPRADGVATAEVTGSGVTPPHVDACGRPGTGGLDTAAQSWGLSLAQKTARDRGVKK
jgi:SRSO17 transposase